MASESGRGSEYLRVSSDGVKKFKFHTQKFDNRGGTSADAAQVSVCCGLVYTEKEALPLCPKCSVNLESLAACLSCKRAVGGQHWCSTCHYIVCALCLGENDTECHKCRGVPLPEPSRTVGPHSEYHVHPEFADDCFGPQARFENCILEHPLDVEGKHF
jgi:hypothetical protein